MSPDRLLLPIMLSCDRRFAVLRFSDAYFRRNKDAFQKADIVDADTVKEVIRNVVLLPSGDQ